MRGKNDRTAHFAVAREAGSWVSTDCPLKLCGNSFVFQQSTLRHDGEWVRKGLWSRRPVQEVVRKSEWGRKIAGPIHFFGGVRNKTLCQQRFQVEEKTFEDANAREGQSAYLHVEAACSRRQNYGKVFTAQTIQQRALHDQSDVYLRRPLWLEGTSSWPPATWVPCGEQSGS
jgi:hypothetical protein